MMKGKNAPVLSVCVVSYNHEKYIKECMDSILAQKIDFEAEILVGNDCSTDRTAEILDKEYGNKITVINRKENMGLCANMRDLFLRAKGKYIFFFSGDDFLYRDDVFEKQVDFLEKNPRYFSVSARNYNYLPGLNIWKEKFVKCGAYSIVDFLRSADLPCMEGTMRNYFSSDQKNNQFLISGAKNNEEIKLWVYCLDKGEMYIIDECMYVYRYRSGERESNYNSTKTYEEMVHDYCTDLKIVEAVYGDKYNFLPLKLLILNRCCIRSSDNIKRLLHYLKSLGVRNAIQLLGYKIYLKFHHYQMPAKWLTEKYLIKDRG